MHTPLNNSNQTGAVLPRAIVIPVQYGSEPGLAEGPKAILEASRRLESFDEELNCEPFSMGVGAYVPIWDEPPFGMTERGVGDALDRGQFPIVLGGDQSLALGAMRATWKRYSRLSVVQITACAHRREVPGDPYARYSLAARAGNLGLDFVQVGVRSLSRLEREQLRGDEPIFWARYYIGHGPEPDKAWDIPDVLTAVPEGPVYLSIDLSALDPSVLPASGTSEPGGLSWYPLLRLLRSLFTRFDVLACDLCELVPGQIHSERLAARLLLKLLAYKFFTGVGR